MVLSLLISLALFVVVMVLTFTGPFGLDETFFAFPASMRALLLLSIFLTVFLTVFFCFNLRQDPVTIILYRLQSLRKSLMEQFYEQKGEMDWARWTMELEQRREGVHAEMKRGIKWGRGRYSEADIDSFIDTSWDELLELIGAWGKTGAGIDEEKLREILTRVLKTLPAASLTGVPVKAAPEGAKAHETSTAGEFAKTGNVVSFETGESPRAAGKKRRLSTPDKPETQQSRRRPASGGAGESTPETRSFKMGGLLAAAMQKRAGPNSTARAISITPKKDRADRLKAPDTEELVEPEEEPEELEEIKEVKEMKEEEEEEELEELEGVEELEELDEAGELEELEEESPGRKSPLAESSRPVADDIRKLESTIEFSNGISGAEEAEVSAPAELEIVSPFSSMFSPPEAEAILQEDGVPHVNSGVLNPDRKTEAGLDKDFKNLVDTVVRK